MGSTFWHTFDFVKQGEKALTTCGIQHISRVENELLKIYSRFGESVYPFVQNHKATVLGEDDNVFCWKQYVCCFFVPSPVADLILAKAK